MKKSLSSHGGAAAIALAFTTFAAPLHGQGAAEGGPRLVLHSGRSLAISNVSLEGGKIVVKNAAEGFPAGSSFAPTAISHVSGEKPAGINRGVALMLMDEPAKAIEALEPVVAGYRATGSVPGNYWLEAARATVYAYSLYNDGAKAEALGKEISEITPESGVDPAVKLGQALALPLTVKFDDRLAKVTDMISDTNPAEVSAFASYFRAKLLHKINRNDEALESYLTIGCLYPASGLVLTSAAEMNAANLIKAKPERREEALTLLNSAVRGAKSTAVGVAASKEIEGLK